MDKIKNIDFSKVFQMESLIDYLPGQVASKTLVQNSALSVTMFAFAQGEGLSTHKSGGDAMVYIIDGKTKITIDKEEFILTKGETIVMPAGVPHGLEGIEQFKMMLVVVF